MVIVYKLVLLILPCRRDLLEELILIMVERRVLLSLFLHENIHLLISVASAECVWVFFGDLGAALYSIRVHVPVYKVPIV